MMTHDPAFHPHDHARCRTQALAHARRRAVEGLRLTPIRQRVLEILAQTHRPLGAYEVLDRLTAEGHPHQPPIAYRALDFLCANGLAHRIECLSAFTACRFPGEAHRPSFLICRTCGRVAETRLPALQDAVAQVADGCGFRPDPAGVEVTGICAPCDNRPGAADDSGVKASPDSGTDRPAIQSWAEPA